MVVDVQSRAYASVSPRLEPPGARWQTLSWWVIVAAVATTSVDYSRLELLNDDGPDTVKWVVRFLLWYLPLVVIIPRWSGYFKMFRCPPSSWLLLWSLLGAASVLWAMAPSQALLLGVATLGLASLGTWYAFVHGWEAFAGASVVGLLITVGSGFVFDLVEGVLAVDRSTGVTPGPTTQGRLAAFGIVMAAGLVWRGCRGRWLWWTSLVVFATALWVTETRTAMGAATIGLLYGGMHRLAPLYRRIFLIGFTVAVVAALVGLGSSNSAVSELGERNDPTSFSGRTEVWSVALELALERPILGYGMGAEDDLFAAAASRGELSFPAGTTHSVTITTSMAGGVVGLVLYHAAFLSAYLYRKRVDAWVFALVPVVVISGLTEAIVNIPSTTLVIWAGCLAVISRGVVSGDD